uniref:RNA-binding protein Musashi 2 n=2 Tax=Anthurium amnicola TaxID=1678845 RepID=A0A1D1YPX6_9ARAE
MKDKGTGRPRGFGFISFADPSVIEKVLEDEHVIDGRTVEVKRTVPREIMSSKGSSKTKKIFVGGLPTSLTEDEFKEYFSSYGKIVEHQIMLDHSTKRSRGFGFVTFENEDSVEEVISQGKMHTLVGKQVEIKKAEPKKAGGDAGTNGRAGYGSGVGNAYGGGFGGGAYGYGGGNRHGYGGRMAGPAGGYGRGYGYGGGFGYGMGYGPGYGGPMHGGTGYGGGDAYGGRGGYGAYGGGFGGARYGGRYHPYGR